MGTTAEMMLTPYGALIVGFFCGFISTLGFVFLTVRGPGRGLGLKRAWRMWCPGRHWGWEVLAPCLGPA